jgi:hypothetical protein
VGGLHCLNLKLSILPLEIVKRGRFLQMELIVASQIPAIYLAMILEMNRMDSVESQASRSDERYLFYYLHSKARFRSEIK